MQASPVLSVSSSFHFCSPNECAEMSAKLSDDFFGKLKFDVPDEQAENSLNEESSKEGMQVSPVLSVSSSFNFCSPNEYAEMSTEFSEDFEEEVKFNVSDNQAETPLYEDTSKDHTLDEIHLLQLHDEGFEEENEEEEDSDYEFSFVCTDPDATPDLADSIFYNGQIRPIFPIFNRDLLFAGGDDGDSKSSTKASSLRPPLRKLFVEERDAPSTSSSSSGTSKLDKVPTGTYCAWSGKAVEASPECKKSNSTGFSKLWRFRDLLNRSSSDGKDAFVFLNHATTSAKTNQRNENAEKTVKIDKSVKVERREVPNSSGGAKVVKGKVRGKGVKGETTSSAHEMHYVRNREMKGEDRRRSYLPYRKDLVGFFTNVNGLSRNVHPF